MQVTVDTNFSQLSKLPREYPRVGYCPKWNIDHNVLSGFAEFGKISGQAPSAAAAAPVQVSASQATPTEAPAAAAPADPSDPSWKPTRRVRTAPGGAQTFSFGGDPEPVNAAVAPPPAVPAQAPQPQAPAPVAQAPEPVAQAESEYRVVDNDGVSFRLVLEMCGFNLIFSPDSEYIQAYPSRSHQPRRPRFRPWAVW